MIPTTYIDPSQQSSPKFGRAFAEGCGGMTTNEAALQPGPVALFGSPRRWALLQRAISEGREWFYGDHAFFGRFRYYRVSRNAYQPDGAGSATPDRFRRFGRVIEPWRKSGRHILLCLQTRGFMELHGINGDRWLEDVIRTLRTATDRDVRIRRKGDPIPIVEALRGAWAVVTFSSAAAIDALIAGIPAWSLAPWAAAHRMGASDLRAIETPYYPADREPFCWRLAWQQWTLQEIASGQAWEALRAA